MFGNARRAYEAGTKTSSNSRELEAAALFKAARLLEQCRQDWDAADRDSRLSDALRYNLRLWTLFQADLARPDHEMPAEMRANLLRLSAFIDRRTFELLGHPEAERLNALIEINRNIAQGLSITPPARSDGRTDGETFPTHPQVFKDSADTEK
ncbi:MAG: flagellar biosynthesis regulator FlaF [Candidatus Eiseniibacteriota bacterium]